MTCSQPCAFSCCSCPNQTIEQRPCQYEAGQAVHQPARPQLVGATEVPARVQGAFPGGERGGGDTQDVEEDGREEGEGDVEEEARVGLEAQDAGADAKQRRGQGLEV